jgi:hypothetical protein
MGQAAVNRQCGVVQEADWLAAIAKIRRGGALDGSAADTLTRGLRLILSRRVRPVYRAVVIERVVEHVTAEIRAGHVNSSADVAKCARTQVECVVTAEPDMAGAGQSYAGLPAPEMLAALSSISGRHREILDRFYVRAEDPRQICAAMNVSADELHRTRAELRKLAARISGASVSDAPSVPA